MDVRVVCVVACLCALAVTSAEGEDPPAVSTSPVYKRVIVAVLLACCVTVDEASRKLRCMLTCSMLPLLITDLWSV